MLRIEIEEVGITQIAHVHYQGKLLHSFYTHTRHEDKAHDIAEKVVGSIFRVLVQNLQPEHIVTDEDVATYLKTMLVATAMSEDCMPYLPRPVDYPEGPPSDRWGAGSPED